MVGDAGDHFMRNGESRAVHPSNVEETWTDGAE